MMVILKLHVLLQIVREIYTCILCYVMEINVTFRCDEGSTGR